MFLVDGPPRLEGLRWDGDAVARLAENLRWPKFPLHATIYTIRRLKDGLFNIGSSKTCL